MIDATYTFPTQPQALVQRERGTLGDLEISLDFLTSHSGDEVKAILLGRASSLTHPWVREGDRLVACSLDSILSALDDL